jgi:thioredoxin-like negative regulator of GroEL
MKQFNTILLAGLFLLPGIGAVAQQPKKPQTATSAAKKTPVSAKKNQPAKKQATAEGSTASKAKIGGIHYFTGSETDFKVEMRSKRKPGILFIANDKGKASQAFESKTLNDTGIVKFVDSNLVAYRVDAPEHPFVATDYSIEDIPCVILFDRNGREIDRVTGYKTIDEFKKFIKQAK